ncbi:cobalamin biosynthesis protein CobW [Pseudoroseomonas globiformis]|uniref:Cobalamin biosynthesis protein CobW n=1 Tax=Teichococcus globiformis TaxID=2307229 RepID=A0ABV7FVZ0_9PROT
MSLNKTPLDKTPATIVTGFLGAGKTTLLRHLMKEAHGRRIAIIVNEFGALGVDGETLKDCGIPGCEAENIVELANGCLCCTVADDFIPTLTTLLDRADPPEHILIETSGLALPKPLIKAFNWPAIRSRVTVDGVVTVVDGPAIAEGRFADDPDAVAAQRRADPSLDHDNPLSELFEDQLGAADIVVLNKADLLDEAALRTVRADITAHLPRAVKIVPAQEGVVPPSVLLGLNAAAEDDLATRPSHHDAVDGEHEHDDFDSFVVVLPEYESADALLARLPEVAAAHDVLRIKGFVRLKNKAMRLAVQGVGRRFRSHFDRAWTDGRDGHLVVIGQTGMNQEAIAKAILA